MKLGDSFKFIQRLKKLDWYEEIPYEDRWVFKKKTRFYTVICTIYWPTRDVWFKKYPNITWEELEVIWKKQLQ